MESLDDQKRSIIREFKEVTNLNENDCEFYLNASQYDLIDALNLYYGEMKANGGSKRASTTSDPIQMPPPESKPKAKIVTMDDLMEESDHDDSDDNERFFVGGGSRNSGGHTQVLGDPKKPYDTKKVFDRVKKSGASVAKSIDKSDKRIEMASGEVVNADPAEVTTIDIYQNGFLLDGETFFNITDPKTREYLEDIIQGFVPHDLYRMFKNKTPKPLVALNNKAAEFYEPSRIDMLFSKKFKVLGNQSAAIQLPRTAVSAPSENGEYPQIVPDSNKPTAHVVYRLLDGTRRNIVVNPGIHTVHDLYNHIRNETRPMRDFILIVDYPKKAIPEDDTLIEQTGLSDSVIFQKCA